MSTELTFDQIVEIVRNLSATDKERLRKELLPKDDLESFVAEVYKKYEKVFTGFTI